MTAIAPILSLLVVCAAPAARILAVVGRDGGDDTDYDNDLL